MTYESNKRTNDPDYQQRKKLLALEASECREQKRQNRGEIMEISEISDEDKQEFVERVKQLIHDSITQHETLVDGLPLEIIDWFIMQLDSIV